jgi:hypothetical protein
MATQYNGGLVAGDVLTAATMNSIGAVWETYTPTVTASSGTITTGSLTLARYARVQKLVFVYIQYTITTAGTANGAKIEFTLPVAQLTTYSNGTALGFAREYFASGWIGNCALIGPNKVRVSKYDDTGSIASGNAVSLNLCYEAQ